MTTIHCGATGLQVNSMETEMVKSIRSEFIGLLDQVMFDWLDEVFCRHR
jgi:hypothetical protein